MRIIIIIFLGVLFLNFCLHELQKLNFYNHGFLHYLQVLELDLEFVVAWKMKFKYLKVCEIFWKYLAFFPTPQYWCGELSNISFLVNEFFFIIKIIPNLWKMTKLLGILLGYFFKSKWYDTNCFEKLGS
jgi:hypothetical protein